MAPERAPAFQFYPKDFLTDGNVAGMSLAERGAYISLLCLCWLERSLPSDIGRLANHVGVTRSVMVKLWPALSRCFRVHPDDSGRLIHPRLEAERAKQEQYRRRQSDAGKASASSRKTTEPLRDGYRGVTTVQPEFNSPISDLPSPDSRQIKPPNPLSAKGGRVKRAERKLAEKILDSRFGRCHHDHDHDGNRESCLMAIIHEQRTKAALAS